MQPMISFVDPKAALSYPKRAQITKASFFKLKQTVLIFAVCSFCSLFQLKKLAFVICARLTCSFCSRTGRSSRTGRVVRIVAARARGSHIGVIAGTQSINPILSGILPDRDDGKVTVESTRVEGMNDHVEMPVTHTFMMRDEDVFAQILHYLEHGQFERKVN